MSEVLSAPLPEAASHGAAKARWQAELSTGQRLDGPWEEVRQVLLARVSAMVSRSESETWRQMTEIAPAAGWAVIAGTGITVRVLREGVAWGHAPDGHA